MIKKELGVFLRVPGNDQQKTIWITPYQYLDHALFIAISSRFQIMNRNLSVTFPGSRALASF